MEAVIVVLDNYFICCDMPTDHTNLKTSNQCPELEIWASLDASLLHYPDNLGSQLGIPELLILAKQIHTYSAEFLTEQIRTGDFVPSLHDESLMSP